MSLDNLSALFMAVLAYSCIAGGETLMKMGIPWLGWRGPKNHAFFRSRRLWLLGLILANLYGIPSAIALRHLPAHVVGAFAGWTVVLLVFLSHRILGERLTRADILNALFFVAGIVTLSLQERPVAPVRIATAILVGLCLLPIACTAGGFVKGFPNRVRAGLFSAAAGTSAGLMVIFLRLLVLRHGFALGGYLVSIHLYLYIFFALLSLAALQLALKRGGMILTAAMKYSTAIITPFLGAVLVFSLPVKPLQWTAAALVVYSVIMLFQRR